MDIPQSPRTRREFLHQAGAGFGMLGLAGTLQAAGLLGNQTPANLASIPHFPPKAKRVIFLFMNGAPSHVDTFDPKPALRKYAGQKPSKDDKGRKPRGAGFMPSPFKFKAHGQGGVVMSELFPNLAKCADDLCVLRSMHTDVPNHEPGLLMMNSGNQQPIRPSLGSWLSYGLGNENKNLPSFVVLCPGRPVVGPQLWSSAFLPGEHQGMSLDTNELAVDRLVANIRHPRLTRAQLGDQVELINSLNRLHAAQRPQDAALDAQIRAMELAFAMQSEATEAFDVHREPEPIREMYGKSPFGQSCLMARRLAERGVRFIQVYYVTKKGKQPWDTHSNNNKSHERLCADSDQATAALLTDLKTRGLLEDTLVVWGGEFGRTPYAQLDKKKDMTKAGRDHHHTGFSMFLAGGGVKGGYTHGATDELGMNAIDKRVHVHDLHATLLHLLGIDHERLTYRYSGRDFRLTDVHGHVAHDIIA
ncbi:hypothetical protein Pan216_26010 [Planctomycetes bacterium Pan216]|uniref:Sulfatase n=1 Tax=Kolteria novifilia TaxID=2527975 RepID=A0A518B425_9BACT|nr:hypothetical protein Pan216_26010 [Planctomycetes bacterium Pan216]